MSLAQTLVGPLVANMAALFMAATEQLIGCQFFVDLLSVVNSGDFHAATLKIFGLIKFESFSDLGSCLIVRFLAYAAFALQYLLSDAFSPLHGGLSGLVGFFLLPALFLLHLYLKYIVAFRLVFWWSVLRMAIATLTTGATTIIRSGLPSQLKNLAVAILVKVFRTSCACILGLPASIQSLVAKLKPKPAGPRHTWYYGNDPEYLKSVEEEERQYAENVKRARREMGIAWRAYWERERAKGDYGMHIGPLERKYH